MIAVCELAGTNVPVISTRRPDHCTMSVPVRRYPLSAEDVALVPEMPLVPAVALVPAAYDVPRAPVGLLVDVPDVPAVPCGVEVGGVDAGGPAEAGG